MQGWFFYAQIFLKGNLFPLQVINFILSIG